METEWVAVWYVAAFRDNLFLTVCSANNLEPHVARTLSVVLVGQLHHATMFQSYHVLVQQPKT